LAEEKQRECDFGMEIYLIRHGETTANADNKKVYKYFCGQYDVTLTEKGIQSAIKLGNELSEIVFNKVYVSDLARTKQTAEYIFSGRVPFVLTNKLRERSLGEFEGKNINDMKEMDCYSHYFDNSEYKNFRHSFTVKTPGGENYRDVIDRVTNFFKEEFEFIQDAKVAIVSHYVTIRCILLWLGIISEEDVFNYRVDNCDPIVISLNELRLAGMSG